MIYNYDIDSRNSKNPTCTHTHTPPTKPLYPPVSSSSVSSTRVWVWGLSELIKKNKINPPIYTPFVLLFTYYLLLYNHICICTQTHTHIYIYITYRFICIIRILMMQSFRKPLRCICSCRFVRLLMYCIYVLRSLGFPCKWVSPAC